MSDNKLETGRLLIKPLEISDYKLMSSHLNNEKIYEMTYGVPYPYSEQNAKEYIERSKVSYVEKGIRIFGIYTKEDDLLIGCISLGCNKSNRSGEVVYWTVEEKWNQGYGSEALAKIIDTAFTCWDYNKVYAYHYTFNKGSEKIMKKNKMKYEGQLREEALKDNVFLDVCLYSILKSEYRE